jgi:4-diphosphocytidyl-2-C-methyl-D-erythritol kinase
MSRESFTLPSFAKVNLHLRVLGKRTDGFHELFTVFQTISLHDNVRFADARDLSLTCDDPKIPCGESNLIMRAATMLRSRCGVSSGASIHLAKNIPSPGGLGGGSSNAAVALIGLNRLWNLEIGLNELHEIAAELGSDVPYFLNGGTAIGTGRGSEIEGAPEFAAPFMIVVAPDVEVPTGEAFAALELSALTNEEAESILKICRFEAGPSIFGHSPFVNDFEKTVFAAHSEIGQVKQTLLDLGATRASMSGSGASVFGIFDNKETRQTALKALGSKTNWRSFAVATISREEYREALRCTIASESF